VGHRLAEQHWKSVGLVRRVAVTVPYFTTAAMMASRTDCVAGLPNRAAEVLCKSFPIKIVATTFPLPSLGISMTWHQRTDADPGARYFRRLVADAVRTT
jgi:DNA-binding transcriptional LysR family regulator